MNHMPILGMGTFRLEGEEAYQSVKAALEVGFRHIDTAQIYGNETEVGEAIADSGIARDELFVTTKVWLDNLGEDAFIPSVKESLEKLQLEKVNLLLIHWPDESGKAAMSDYLAQLKLAKDLGYTDFIGVSNFTNLQLEQAIAILGEGSIFTNQVEVHPYLQNLAVRQYCKTRGVQVTGYMPLAVGKVMDDSRLQAIAKTHNATPADIAIAWQLQQGLVTIPSSTKKAHLAANLAASQIVLSDKELEAIGQLEVGERIADPDFAPDWD